MYRKLHLYAIALTGLIITACTVWNIFNNVHILDAGNIFLLLLYVCFAGAYIIIYQRMHFRFRYTWLAGLACYLLTVIFAGLSLYRPSWNIDGVFYQVPLIIALMLTHMCFVNFSRAEGFFYSLVTVLLKIIAAVTAAAALFMLFAGGTGAADFLQKLTVSLIITLIFGDFMVFYVNYFYRPENDNYNILTLYRSDRDDIYADKYGNTYRVKKTEEENPENG